MKKKEFLLRLKIALMDLPENEILKSVNFYSECIDDRVEEGMTEYQAVSELGDFVDIVANIILEYNENNPNHNVSKKQKEEKVINHTNTTSEQPKKKDTKISKGKMALIICAFPFLFIFVITFLSIILSLYVAVFIVYVTTIATSVFGLGFGFVSIFLYGLDTGLMYFGISVILLGVTFMIVIPLVKAFIKYNIIAFKEIKSFINKQMIAKRTTV